MSITSLFLFWILLFNPVWNPPLIQTTSIIDSDSLSITYLGNMGVLLASGEDQVLIDALHKPYKPDYLPPSPELLRAMEMGTPPFQSLDAALVTHIHRDHMDTDAIMESLDQQAELVVIGSPQLYDSLFHRDAFGHWRKQFLPALGDEVVWEGGNNIKISSIPMKHTYQARHSAIQNFAYLVEIGGRKVLHVGDVLAESKVFKSHRLEKRKIDVAILPFWMMQSDKDAAFIKKYIGAETLIATHLSPLDGEDYAEKIRRHFPDAICFLSLEQRVAF